MRVFELIDRRIGNAALLLRGRRFRWHVRVPQLEYRVDRAEICGVAARRAVVGSLVRQISVITFLPGFALFSALFAPSRDSIVEIAELACLAAALRGPATRT